jgi:type I restriction enzyme S subunit
MAQINNDWKKITLGDLGKIITGGTPSSRNPEYFGERYPFITPSDIDGFTRYVDTERFLSEEGKEDQINKLLPSGAICFVCIGNTIGKVCMTKETSFTNQQINSIIVDNQNYNNFFIYYLLCDISESIKSIASGAATPIVNKSLFSSVNINVPSLDIQNKIAAILSAYDDLIENNLRRIKILEEMAQALYREWFVHFRFPGHEKVRLVDSPLGKIPEGWRVEKLGNIIELNYGKGLPKEKRREGCVPVYGSSGIVGYHDRSIVDGPGIIVGRKGNVGSVFWSDTDFYPIDTVYYVSSELPLRYLFYDLQTRNFINNDAAVPGLNRKQAYSLETILPTPELMDKFCNITEAFGKQASILRNKNEILRRTRDLLLPKLISGEIDVSELDIKVPEELD